MPGINQLGGAQGIVATTPTTEVTGGANQGAPAGVEPSPSGAVQAVPEFERAPKESQDDRSVEARREARRFADLRRSEGRPDPETGDVINISAAGRAQSTGDTASPTSAREEPLEEDPDRPSSIRGEPVRRFDDLFAKGYRREGDEGRFEDTAPEAPEPEQAPVARAETTQVAPEEPAPDPQRNESAQDLPDESISEVSEAS